MEEPKTWTELFDALEAQAVRRPCDEWRLYLLGFETISDALRSLPVDTPTNEVAPYSARLWLYSQFRWRSTRKVDPFWYDEEDFADPEFVASLRFTEAEISDIVMRIRRELGVSS